MHYSANLVETTNLHAGSLPGQFQKDAGAWRPRQAN